MTNLKEKTRENLIHEYYALVKKGIQFQKNGDIKAYTLNAIQAENIASKLQAVSRNN